MNIQSIETAEDAVKFAREEFERRNIDWNIYELDSVLQITDEIITKFKLKNRKLGWDIDFILKRHLQKTNGLVQKNDKINFSPC